MTSVEDFYKNEHILITGGTGFVGKLLISKLLLSCPTVQKISLLIRKKNETNVNQRLEQLFNDVIFEPLKKMVPNFQEKIDLIEGDCEKKQLGLSQTDRFLITQNVTIIFHCAANVEFTNDLKKEINTNVCSAIEIINLIKFVRNLKAFIYVSSSYSNCHLPVIEEKYYKPKIHYKTLIKLINAPLSNINEQCILGEVANTYFLSKAVAEQVIMEEGKGLPIAIFRPSAIISTYKEPICGWTDKAFSSTAVMKSVILGYCSSIICSDEVILDMVPGDYTVNALIAVAWDTHNRYLTNCLPEPRIFNYVSMTENPLYLKTFILKVYSMTHIKPSMDSVWFPVVTLRKTKMENRIFSLIRPWLFAYILCWWRQLLGLRYKRLLNGCYLYEVLMNVLTYFINKPHIYFNDNIQELWQSMCETDQKMFAFDIKQINWNKYLTIYYEGILKYVIKEKNRDEDAAFRHYIKNSSELKTTFPERTKSKKAVFQES